MMMMMMQHGVTTKMMMMMMMNAEGGPASFRLRKQFSWQMFAQLMGALIAFSSLFAALSSLSSVFSRMGLRVPPPQGLSAPFSSCWCVFFAQCSSSLFCLFPDPVLVSGQFLLKKGLPAGLLLLGLQHDQRQMVEEGCISTSVSDGVQGPKVSLTCDVGGSSKPSGLLFFSRNTAVPSFWQKVLHPLFDRHPNST